MLNFFPNYFSNKLIALYIFAVVAAMLLFNAYTMEWYNYAIGLVAVVGFFYFASLLSGKWQVLPEKKFIQNLLIAGFVIRAVWVIFSYYFYIDKTGMPFEFGAADSIVYHDMGWKIRVGLETLGEYIPLFLPPKNIPLPFSDSGYPHYLGTLYWIFGSDNVFLARIVKAIWGALTCWLVYRLAARNFGESTGRMAGIFCMLMPHLIYYTGIHTKETEMTFLVVAFLERADYVIRSNKFTVLGVAAPILLAVSLFSFRTVLGAVALFAFVTAIVFVPNRVMSGWKRIVPLLWIGGAGFMLVGGAIMQEMEELWSQREANQENLYVKSDISNSLVSTVSLSYKAAFIPAALIVPIPATIYSEGQDNQRLVHSGLFVRGAMSFFLLAALWMLIRQKQWRSHILILVFYAAYLGILAMSAMFFQERFHLLLTPLLMVFAAYGISQATNKTKTYFTLYMVAYFAIILGWQYFKIAGRG
jgi:4-amino-4-deoxy-L-arabinose transferase-like glycosyltransferase